MLGSPYSYGTPTPTATGYVPGFHMEVRELQLVALTPARYILHVFRTCSSGTGDCDENKPDAAGKSFQFTIQAGRCRFTPGLEAVDPTLASRDFQGLSALETKT